MNFPANLKYTREHEWIRAEDNQAVIGITEYAQKELGDIVFVDIDTEGESLAAGERFGTVEAVKTVSDLYMPVSGVVLEFNKALESAPETVNKMPYGDGWMIRIEMSDPGQLSELMTSDEYEAFTNE